MPGDCKIPMKQGSRDDYQTPPYALKPLLPYIPKDWVVWECAAGKGYLSAAFIRLGYRVISSDIITGQDFLTWEPEEHWDIIVTNPPYKYKQQFLERCYELGKPFALLVPLTTFETPKRQTFMKKHGVQVIFFDKRINFMTPSGGGKGAWFATAWFTNWMNLENDLNWEHLDADNKWEDYFKSLDIEDGDRMNRHRDILERFI